MNPEEQSTPKQSLAGDEEEGGAEKEQEEETEKIYREAETSSKRRHHCSHRCLVISGVATGIFGLFLLIVMLSPRPVLKEAQCKLRLGMMRYDTGNFGKYDKYFRDDSTVTLAQAGTYSKADGIREYVQFAYGKYSPFLIDNGKLTGLAAEEEYYFQGYDRDTDLCQFLVIRVAPVKFNPQHTRHEGKLHTILMMKASFNYRRRYLKSLDLFLPQDFLNVYFAYFLNSDPTREYICSVMQSEHCAEIIETPENCTDHLALLPVVDSGYHFDGNTQGCRILHGVLAATNAKHCPHLSFTPMEDRDGKIKCQETSDIQPEDFFTTDDFEIFDKFALKHGFDPAVGHDYVIPKEE